MIQLDSLSLQDRMELGLRGIRNDRFRQFVRQGLEKAQQGDLHDLQLAANYKWFPVTPEEFILGKQYMKAGDSMWPRVLDSFIELNSGNYIEALLTGAIGSAKTTLAVYTTAYQLYLISCLRDPHKLFQLDPMSEIEFIFQSVTSTLAKEVDYQRFRNSIIRCEYFNKQFMFDKEYTSELRFPNHLVVKPITAASTGAIGQNVIGGVIDELNFMAIVEKSKQTIDRATYDQAIAVYEAISRRRKSRFMQQGKLPGILCLVSSKRYPGQFTDRKQEEAAKEIRETGSTTIYVYDKRTWDVKPEGTFLGPKFPVYIGDETRKPKILEEEERHKYPTDQVVDVPVEHKHDFESDIMGALRDIAGVSTIARFPFILDPEIITQCMGRVNSIFSGDETNFQTVRIKVFPKRFFHPEFPRFVHVDLAVSGDSAGLCIGCCPGFERIFRGEQMEMLPQILIDGVLEITPPRGGEILFFKIRQLIYLLRDELKLNVKWVTFDRFQSTDSMQMLRQKGFSVGITSMDEDTGAYDITKLAFYDKRVLMPYHVKTLKEFVGLEKDTKEDKIDHPPNGSKDCSDAVAGVVSGLTLRRETWVRWGVPLMGSTPNLHPAPQPKREVWFPK